MSYLKCKMCGGCYKLHEDETPSDFESCNCGGELEYYDSHGRKTRFIPIYSKGTPRSTSESPLVRVILIFVAFLVITKSAGLVVMSFIETASPQGPSNMLLFFLILIGVMVLALLFLRFILKR